MAWHGWMAVSIGVAVALGSTVAEAAPVMIPMDSEADLLGEGFEHHSDAGTSTFDGGMMVVDTVGYEEWILYSGTPSKWWDNVHPSKGWWVEARLRVDQAEAGCPGPGIWIHDRGKLFRLRFGNGVIEAQPGGEVPVETSEFHVYRFEDYGNGVRQVTVDDVVVLDLSGEEGGDGTWSLVIGDLGGCGASVVTWDHFAYDTFALGSEDEDTDEDTIPNAEDNCFDVANADQANTDGDGLGDVCDPCPIDEFDDSDGDGVCDSDDACPNDPTTTEEPCPFGSSGFMGDGFGDGPLDGTDGGTSVGTVTVTVSASGGSFEPGTGGCGCYEGGTPQRAAWWAGLVVLACRRRRRAHKERR